MARRKTLASIVAGLGVAALIVLILASVTYADTPSTPATAATPADALRGPSVDGAAAEPTLVHRTFDGAVERLAVQPTEAAVLALGLDDDTLTAVRAILNERAKALDDVVLDHIDLLTQIETAEANGEWGTLVKIAWSLHKDFKARFGDETLADRFREVLDPAEFTKFERLVDGYWDAVVADEAGADANRLERFAAKRGAMIEHFAKDIERAFQRISMDGKSGSGEEEFERLIAMLDPTDDQEARIRALAEKWYIENRMAPSKEDERELVMGIYDLLDDARQRRFVELIISMDNK